MTVRELRKILFDVSNQNLTVKEIRELLFDIDEQDAEITQSDLEKFTSPKYNS